MTLPELIRKTLGIVRNITVCKGNCNKSNSITRLETEKLFNTRLRLGSNKRLGYSTHRNLTRFSLKKF